MSGVRLALRENPHQAIELDDRAGDYLSLVHGSRIYYILSSAHGFERKTDGTWCAWVRLPGDNYRLIDCRELILIRDEDADQLAAADAEAVPA